MSPTRRGALLALGLTSAVLLRVHADDPAITREAEPNDDSARATPFLLGKSVAGTVASPTDQDWFKIDLAHRGAYRFTITRPGATALPLRVSFACGGAEPIHTYEIDRALPEHQFFPVLEKGPVLVLVRGSRDEPGATDYTFLLREAPVELDGAARAAAAAAIDRGVARLLASPPDATTTTASAVEGLVLAALADGKGARERARVIDELYLPHVGSQRTEPNPPGTWKGKKLGTFVPGGGIYHHAVLTLGLAEAAGSGNAKAKALLPAAVELLLGAQLGPARCPEWVPVDATSHEAGGWRYNPSSLDSDLSVTGWCFVALAAANASGVEVAGTRDALAAASRYVAGLGGPTGFGYVNATDPTDVRNAIGALLTLLSGDESESLDASLASLDQHLPAWTQVEAGDGYPLYYAYYATRVNYLRGGRPWNVWRAALVQQLLDRQDRTTGGWTGFREEDQLGERYATAVSVLVLRLCLDEVPAYMKREVRGF